MKTIYLLFMIFIPMCSFAQVDVKNNTVNNNLWFEFNQSSVSIKRKENSDLSLEKSNELINQSFMNSINQKTRISSLKKVEEYIPYEYDEKMSFSQNFVRSVIHEMFFSKPIRL